jgi:hypothetical protein
MRNTIEGKQSPAPNLISRRLFLQLFSGVVGLVVAENLFPHFNGLVAGSEYSPRVAELQQQLEQHYGLKLYNGLPTTDNFLREIIGHKIGGEEFSSEEIENILTSILPEMNKYPRSFWKKNKIRAIRLIKNLTYRGVRVGGLCEIIRGEIYIDCVTKNGNNYVSEAEIQAILHHEIYHAVDFWNIQIFGISKSNAKKWIELHNCGCIPYYDLSTTEYLSNIDGLAELISNPEWVIAGGNYSRSNPSEDQANTAGSIMVHSTLIKNLKRINKDQNGTPDEQNTASIWRKKIDKIRENLNTVSGGFHNSKFWQDLIEHPEIFDLQYRTNHESSGKGGGIGRLDELIELVQN